MQRNPKRGARRARTLAVTLRRRKLHLERVHGGDAARVDCVCELAAFFFAKRGAVSCNCRKHPRGRPRIPTGLCKLGVRDRIYERRRADHETATALVNRALDADDDRCRWWLFR